jgi:hypothetical protein
METRYRKYMDFQRDYSRGDRYSFGQYGGNSYKSEKLSFRESADEIHFWGHQMMEHCLFLATEIQPHTKGSSLKQEAESLHDKFKKYMDLTFKNIDEHKIELDDQDFNNLNENNFDFDTITNLVDQLEKLKNDIKHAISLSWIGFTYPAEIEHMLKELKHFKKNLKSRLTPEDIIQFYAEEAAEHTMLAHKLINPEPLNINDIKPIDGITQEASDKTLKEALNYTNLPQANSNNVQQLYKYIKDSATSGEHLEQKIKNQEIKSIINPDLIAHEGRETKRFFAVMKRLNKEFNLGLN